MLTSAQFASFYSLEHFLDHFNNNKLDIDVSFVQDGSDVEDLHKFLVSYSAPGDPESFPFLKAALLLLLFHPLIAKNKKKDFKTAKLPPLRSILLQIIGRCVRRASRAQLKTLPITVPLLLPHLPDSKLLTSLIEDLHSDLRDRMRKFSQDRDKLYNDALTANLLIVFDYLYLVNESFISINYSGKIAAAFFYHSFPVDFDICDDYARWREMTEIPDRNLPFAFCDYPWIFDLTLKRNLLLASNGLKQRHHLQDAFFRAIFDGVQSTSLNIQVRRGNILRDACDQLLSKPSHHLAKQLRVTFVGEEGVDEGGLRKEFFHLCWCEMFNSLEEDYEFKNIFREIEESHGTFWFGHHLEESDRLASLYTFTGMLLALAIYNGALVAPRFPLFLFKKLLKWPVRWDDYTEIDGVLVRSINSLVSAGKIEEVYFSIPGSDEIELIPGGSNTPVNHGNLHSYIDLVSKYFLNDSVAWQFSAFKSGFESICGDSVIYGYRPDELFALAYGSDEFSLRDLMLICTYEGGYTAESLQIIWLWQLLLDEFDDEMRRNFLFFTTGSSRAPLGGLQHLKTFTITRSAADSDRLPTAHTCFNTLLLPQYADKQKLSAKLRLALQHNQGFGLI